ncbi:ion channel [Parasynechococcus sp.]|uniref:ion channel n=1 Tax=Parasynechococcus sp. TaxID=3101203 RepID=UPI0037040F38
MRVGPISITSRRLAIPGVDFTQPYYLGKSGVLLPMSPPSILSLVQVFFGWAVISSVLVLISVLLVVGSLIWLAERNHNSEQFPRDWLPGVSSGMWFAVVTLTIVGYGDKAPTTRAGRGITGTWMVISLITVSSFTASLASAFTLFLSGATETSISTPEQLNSGWLWWRAPVAWSWPNAATCRSLVQPTSRAPFNCWLISRPMP